MKFPDFKAQWSSVSDQTKSRAWKIGVVVVLLASAFAVGRYTVPSKVETKTETKTETQDTTQAATQEAVKVQIKYVKQYVYIHDVAKNVHEVTETVKKPDGTVTTTVTLDDKSQSQTSSSSQAVVTKDTEKTVTTEDNTVVDTKTDTVSTKVVDSTKPQWHLRADVGAGARFVGQLTPTLVLGVGAERRVIGPFFMGLWAQTTLNLISPQTPPYAVNAGLSLGLEL